jgi:hypothetical protein
VNIGIKFDPEMEKTIKFWQDKKVPRVDVGTSCERCPLLEADCKERVIPPTILERLAEGREREEILRHLIQQ